MRETRLQPCRMNSSKNVELKVPVESTDPKNMGVGVRSFASSLTAAAYRDETPMHPKPSSPRPMRLGHVCVIVSVRARADILAGRSLGAETHWVKTKTEVLIHEVVV